MLSREPGPLMVLRARSRLELHRSAMLLVVDDLAAENRKRAQLEANIASSERAKRITFLLGAAFAASGVVLHLAGESGMAAGALLLGLFIAATGLWISGGHIQDFRRQLRSLDGHRRAR
jgi:hypothetical protein